MEDLQQQPKHLTIAQLKNLPQGGSHPFTGYFLLKKSAMRTAKTGTVFMSVEVCDSTGSFSFNAFDNSIVFNLCKQGAEGTILELQGMTDYYQGKLSPRIQHADLIHYTDAEKMGIIHGLIECSQENPQELWEELQSFIESIEHAELQSTVKVVFEEIGTVFQYSAAAISMHHAYRNGLLEHTVHMARAAKALFPLYKEVYPDLAMAGILLHDVGKVLEYETNLTVKKTRLGILQGHVILGYRLVRKAALQSKLGSALLERLEHIILSHQGELEWGAAVMASTPEAVFVSMIDNLDAKMGVVQYALRHPSTDKEFSEYSPALKSSVLTISPNISI